MANKFCVSLTHSKDNTDKSTVAFVVANAAVGSGKETLVFLSVEAVRLAQKGYADDIHEEGFAPLKELMDNFVKAGGDDLRLLAVLQEAQARREQPRRRRDHRGRRQARRVPVRRQPLRQLLARVGARHGQRIDRHPLDADAQLRRRRSRLRQRPAAADPPAHRPAGTRPAPRVPLDRVLGRGGLSRPGAA